MKILHITTYDTGGAGIACIRIHNALLAQGIDSKVLVLNKKIDSPEVYEVWEEMSWVSKLRHFIGHTFFLKKLQGKLPKKEKTVELFSFPQSYWTIKEHTLFKDADIVNLHWVTDFMDYQRFFSNNKKKIVWTIHDCVPFSNGFHYPVEKNDTSYSTLEHEIETIKKEALAGSTIHVVSPSKWLKNVSEESTLFKTFKHSVIANCRSQQFKYIRKATARQTLNISEEIKMVLFVADMFNYERKGLPYLLKAIELLKDEKIQFICAGQGSFPNNKGIKSYGKIMDINLLNTLYAAADIYVIPSLNDNLPNTVQEALCSGAPVVGFESGGIPEMISPKNGIICERGNSEILANQIKLALTIPWDRKKISETAMEKYSPKSCAKAYFDLYLQIK